jgi:hypothetical protein
VLAGDGDGEEGEELVAAGVGEPVSVGDGDDLVAVEAGDGDDDRHRWPWPCLQWTGAPAEEACAARAIGMVKPVIRAAATAARAAIAFMKTRP